MPETVTDLGWWCIHGEALLDMLRAVEAGENPDVVYAEAYASADHEEAL